MDQGARSNKEAGAKSRRKEQEQGAGTRSRNNEP